MFRKDLTDLLLDQPRSVAELAECLEMKPKEIEDDLKHLLRSIRHEPYRAVIEPATCQHCGFTFAKDRLRKPGKCPQCKHTWIREPRISLAEQR